MSLVACSFGCQVQWFWSVLFAIGQECITRCVLGCMQLCLSGTVFLVGVVYNGIAMHNSVSLVVCSFVCQVQWFWSVLFDKFQYH